MELGDRTCNHIADFRQFGDGDGVDERHAAHYGGHQK